MGELMITCCGIDIEALDHDVETGTVMQVDIVKTRFALPQPNRRYEDLDAKVFERYYFPGCEITKDDYNGTGFSMNIIDLERNLSEDMPYPEHLKDDLSAIYDFIGKDCDLLVSTNREWVLHHIPELMNLEIPFYRSSVGKFDYPNYERKMGIRVKTKHQEDTAAQYLALNAIKTLHEDLMEFDLKHDEVRKAITSKIGFTRIPLLGEIHRHF